MSKWHAGVLGAAGVVGMLVGAAQALTAVPVLPAMPGVNPLALEIPFVSPNAAAVAVISASSAWGGVRRGSEPTLSDRVVEYKINATLDPVAHTVEGKEKLTWRNRK